MKSAFAVATVMIAFAAQANAATMYTCMPPISSRDDNPVVSTELSVDGNGGITVLHNMADGSSRDRARQYFDVSVKNTGYYIIWRGTQIDNPRISIMGVIDLRGGRTYTETWFRDGRPANRVGPYRCHETHE